jgi:hypothetical protein
VSADTPEVVKTATVPDRVRTFRAPDELWQAAQDRAWERRDKEGVAAPLRLALRAFAADPDAFEDACRKILGEDPPR